jgi:hypothetical protein
LSTPYPHGERSASLGLTSLLRIDMVESQTLGEKGCDMNAVSDKPSVSALRWVARVFGTLSALIVLAVVVQETTYWAWKKMGPPASDYLADAGFLLLFVGCIVGWFKDLAASLLILGGVLLILVTALAFPGKVWLAYFFAWSAIPGFLFLYVHLVSKKK